MSENERGAFVRCFVSATCTLVGLLLFDGALFSAHDGIFDWSRDESTYCGIALLLVLLAVARRCPRLIRPRAFTAIAIVSCVTGSALCSVGVVLGSAPFIVVGVLLLVIDDVWCAVLWLLACSTLGIRRVTLCLALSGVVAVPVAYVLNVWAPYPLVAVAACCLEVAIPLVCYPLTRPFFARLAMVGVPVEQQVTNPRSFLPLSHALYVYLFVFNVAFGFALRCEGITSPGEVSLATFATMVGATVYAARAKGRPKVDALFVTSFLLVCVGFMLLLFGDVRTEGVASALLVAGYMCFQLLAWLAMCSAAARSVGDAIPMICWGTALGYLGICAGVGLWMIPNLLFAPVLAGDGLLQGLIVTGTLAGIVLYTVLTRRSFVFDAAIESIEPDAPPVEVRYVDALGDLCTRVVERCGLTERESEVLRLLARGNNSSHVQSELGIGYNTVKYHVRNVYAKLGVHSQQELIDLVRAARDRTDSVV